MCWLCGCADHVGPGNETKDNEDPGSNQLNDIIEK